MWNAPTRKQLEKLPKLYSTEGTPTKDKIIHMHFFIGNCDWYIAESDGDDTFFGFAIINGDYEMAEWGYMSLEELMEIKIRIFEVDRDLHWKPVKACEVDKIRTAQRW